MSLGLPSPIDDIGGYRASAERPARAQALEQDYSKSAASYRDRFPKDYSKPAQAYRDDAELRADLAKLDAAVHTELRGVARQMLPWQERVVVELADLHGKVERLRVFTGTPVFLGLPDAEQVRQARQLSLMYQLCQVLQERIAAW